MEYIAAKIFALYAIFFGMPNFHTPTDPHWSITSPWERIGSYYTLASDGSLLVEECRKNRNFYVKFPIIVGSIQEIAADGLIIHSHGQLDQGTIGAQFSAPSLYCGHLADVKKLTWTIYSSSAYFSRINYFPYLTSSRPLQSSFNNIVHAISCAAMMFLSIFMWIVFRGKTNPLFIVGFIATSIAWGGYGLVSSSGLWGLHLSPIASQCLGDAFIITGMVSFYLLLLSQQLIHRPFVWLNLLVSPFTLLMVAFGGSAEISQAAVNLNFVIYSLATVDMAYCAALHIWRRPTKSNFGILFGIIFVIVVAHNDILMTIGYIDTVMMTPLGLTVVMVSLGFFLQSQVTDVYRERDEFKERLDKMYRGKIEKIQRNAIAHTVANTAQMIAHDLKRPFSVFQLALFQIKAGRSDAQSIENFAQSVSREMTYVDNLIADLLSSGTTRANKLEPVDLSVAISEVWNSHQGRDVKFIAKFGHSDSLFVDRTKVLRILANLLGNAVEAVGQQGGEIWVLSEDDYLDGRGCAKITVGNTGSYIPPEELECLFTKFYTRNKEAGSGLGLAICHDFVSDHGGRIWCVSSRERGTEFIFTLPTA